MTVSAPGNTGAPSHAMSKRLWRASPPLVLALYLVFAFLFFGSSGSWTTHYIGTGTDPFLFMWFLNWWPFAIGHGLDPFWTHYVWYPQAFDLAWATPIPALALLAAPITLTLGATFALNLLSVLSPALSAWTAYLLGRDVTHDDIAAFFCGWFFGFSAYELGQLQVHLNLAAIFLVPLLVLLALRRFRGTLSRPRFIVFTAILLFMEFGISKEIVATFCVMGAIVWLVFRWFGDPEDRPALWRLAFDFALALCTLVVLALPYEIYLVRGASAVPGTIALPILFSADLLNFILPTAAERLGHSVAAPIAGHFTGNIYENGAYLGLPLILILSAAAWQFRRNLRLRALAVAIATLAVLSLGQVPHVAGRIIFIPLPWAALLNVPLIRAALPVRITMYLSLGAGLLVAAWIASSSGRGYAIRIGSGLLAGLFLLPNPLAFAWSSMPQTPPALKQPELSARLGPSPKILILPFWLYGPGDAWQLQAKMAFTQTGGYVVGFVPRDERQSTAIRDFMSGAPSRHFANALTGFCMTHHVTAIAMAPDTSPKLADAVLSLGWRTEKLKGVTLVRVPPPGTLDYFTVTGDHWPSDRKFSWIGRKVTIRAGHHPLVVLISGYGRPTNLPPVIVAVTIDGTRQTDRVDRSSRISITIPAGRTATLRAARTFRSVSKDYDHEVFDTRHLSVQIAITPERTGAVQLHPDRHPGRRRAAHL